MLKEIWLPQRIPSGDMTMVNKVSGLTKGQSRIRKGYGKSVKLGPYGSTIKKSKGKGATFSAVKNEAPE